MVHTMVGPKGILALAAFACGCAGDLGPCDEAAATSPIYYDEGGFPAYPGQALVEVSCGAGTFCHASGIPPEDRFGAPRSLDLDVGVAVEPSELERLAHARRAAWNMRHAIYEQVAAGAMPPSGAAGDTAASASARYRAHPGTAEERRLPPARSPEGLEMLRNWLACGAHVIEATEGASSGVGDIAPRIAVCPEGQAACDGACVDVLSNPAQCGACGVSCGAGQECVEGACRCTNGLAACGVECVDLQTDVAHCGACASDCGDRFCADGTCADACPADTTDCGGSCVRLDRNLANCGGCGNACGAGEACEASVCSCAAGFDRCADACVDLQSSASHCGACEQPCGDGAVCAGGVCGCPAGLTDCSGRCTDLQSDPTSCGGCGAACASGEGCVDGGCVGCGPEASFAGDVAPILDRSCTGSGCHSGARPAASLALSTGRAYDELIGAPASCGGRTLVVPGDVEGSYLWSKLTGVGICSGTQMPKRGESLPDAELALIQSWICRGAAND